MRLVARIISIVFLVICLIAIGLSFAATVAAQSPYPYGSSQCRLTVRTNQYGGYVYPPGDNYYYYGTTVTVSESTYSGYIFVGWYMNGQYQGRLSTISVTMNQDIDLYAVFQQRMSILTIANNPSDGGTTTPPAGIYNYSGSASVRVFEYPATENTFAGWYLDGIYQGLGTSINVNMGNGDHQLTAFFSGNGVLPTPQPTATPTPDPTPPPAPNLPKPTLSFFCASSTTLSGFNVRIQGALAINQTGVPGAGIRFSYSTTAGATWHELAYAITNGDGSFSVVWMPTASGNYLVKGEYSFYSNVSSTVNFAVEPNSQNQVFSVTSNSTLSSLAFDSTTSTISFTASGPDTTFGYVQTCIPKSLLSDTSTLKVLLDGQNVPYIVEQQNDIWIITLQYHHSSHSIVMALNTVASTPTPTPTSNPTTNPTSNPTTNPTSNPTTSPISTPTNHPSSTPTVPELSPLVILPLIVVLLGLAIFAVKKRRSKS